MFEILLMLGLCAAFLGAAIVVPEDIATEDIRDRPWVFNDAGNDNDFRIEGDTATQLFVIDAGLDAVQIGTTTAGTIADFRSTAIVLNEVGADVDFRVESDTVPTAIVLDAGLEELQIGVGLALQGDISPAALSGDVNNWAPTGLAGAAVIRVDGGAAARNITGLTGGRDGRIVILTNLQGTATQDITLVHESGSSTAANRFNCANVANVAIRAKGAVMCIYDATASRWFPIAI